MNKDETILERMWSLAFVSAFFCVVSGCPSARRARVMQSQETAGWQVEHIQNFRVRVSETNSNVKIEIMGSK